MPKLTDNKDLHFLNDTDVLGTAISLNNCIKQVHINIQQLIKEHNEIIDRINGDK
jgi:hypothetical protein